MNTVVYANLVTLSMGASSIRHSNILRKIGPFSVQAPLPESYGIDVSNDMTQPFSSFLPTGPIQTIAALKNVSTSAGFAIGKFWTGTGTGDITFDMNFVAQNNPVADIYGNVLGLYIMACAHKITLPLAVEKTIAEAITALLKGGAAIINFGSEKLSNVIKSFSPTHLVGSTITPGEVGDVLYWLGGPPKIRLLFGTTYTLGGASKGTRITMSGLEPRFSNIVDYNGIPVSCTCSVTLTLEQPLFLDNLPYVFAPHYTGKTKNPNT